ncbi:XdhC family protein [Altericroceibacterium endophyticum]|nr:XdhC family protein [Altericroceibacterium endophyticum]
MRNASITPSFADDVALRHSVADGWTLCTLVGIEGSFSRRLGAQLAIGPDGTLAGSLADGCLEQQLVSEAKTACAAGAPILKRFGAGSSVIDFQLPCGSGLDILIDPAPDQPSLTRTIDALDNRKPAELGLPLPANAPASLLQKRLYKPALRLLIFGEGPELEQLRALALSCEFDTVSFDRRDPQQLALGQKPQAVSDPQSAIVLLFHDHEWERSILEWALENPGFYLGAQGGQIARQNRLEMLQDRGYSAQALTRIRSPIGLIPHSRDPAILALSVLAEVVAQYEQQQTS